MPKPVDPYSRLYWRLIDDEKFAEIYGDDHHFALWCRLLMTADMAWPSSAALPFGTRKASYQKLVNVGLVDPAAGNRYRIHGLDAERSKRQTKARDAISQRWDRDTGVHRDDADRNADALLPYPVGTTKRLPSRAEPRRDEKRRDEHIARARLDPDREGLPHLTPDAQEAVETVAQRPITTASDKVLTDLDGLVERHGVEMVAQTMGAVANGGTPTWPQLVYGARNRLEPIPGAPDSKAERERHEQTTHERRKAAEAKALDEPWRRELREKLRQAEAAR